MDVMDPLIPKDRQRAAQAFQRLLDKACMVCGGLSDLLIFSGLLMARFMPPMDPKLTPEEVAEHYRKYDAEVRICATLFILQGLTYPFFQAGIINQMRRIPGLPHNLISLQTIASTTTSVLTYIPGLYMCQLAYRQGRDPTLTYELNDILWMYIVIPFCPLFVQSWGIAAAIYVDHSTEVKGGRKRHLWPRWLGYYSFFTPFLYFPAIAAHFVYSGPLAWNGVFAYWVPIITFGIQMNVVIPATYKGIDIPMDHELDQLNLEDE